MQQNRSKHSDGRWHAGVLGGYPDCLAAQRSAEGGAARTCPSCLLHLQRHKKMPAHRCEPANGRCKERGGKSARKKYQKVAKPGNRQRAKCPRIMPKKASKYDPASADSYIFNSGAGHRLNAPEKGAFSAYPACVTARFYR